MNKGYTLLDSGEGHKVERFGEYTFVRPCSQALWRPEKPMKIWEKEADALFTREWKGSWKSKRPLPKSWEVIIDGLSLRISTTDFGHLGVFPEHADSWQWMADLIAKRHPPPRVLNLFAYSGGATLAAARAGAEVCHLDASAGMVSWAKENAQRNKLNKAPIRWIVDDAKKFLKREVRRKKSYDAIILDPPSFGHGSKGQIFKIDKDVPLILDLCRELLSEKPLFIFFSCHTPGYTPTVLGHLLDQTVKGLQGTIETGEMLLQNPSKKIRSIPNGAYARWSCKHV